MNIKRDYKTTCDHEFMIKKGEFKGQTTVEIFQTFEKGPDRWVGRQSLQNLKIKEAKNV